MRAAALGLLLLAGACTPRLEAPVEVPLAFDCAAGFDALSARITGDAGLKVAPVISGDPYLTFNAPDGGVSYIVTTPGAPAHPAIARQTAGASGVVTDGCPYGNAKAYAQFVAYVESLAAATGRKP